MWAPADETRDRIVGLYRHVWEHADATINELELDAVGSVAWWPPERRDVTLHRILIHMIAETNRHAGHADIVRELTDGTVGLRRDNDNMAPGVRSGGPTTATGWSTGPQRRRPPWRCAVEKAATCVGASADHSAYVRNLARDTTDSSTARCHSSSSRSPSRGWMRSSQLSQTKT